MRIVLVALGVAATALSARSQPGARVHGIVRDAAGSALAGAQLLAHDPREKTDRSTTSGPGGAYAFDHLLPGHYEFKAIAPGYAGSAAVAQDLAAGADQTLDFVLSRNPGFLKRLTSAYTGDWKSSS